MQEVGEVWEPFLRGAIPLGESGDTYQPFVFLISYRGLFLTPHPLIRGAGARAAAVPQPQPQKMRKGSAVLPALFFASFFGRPPPSLRVSNQPPSP
jgi:hypothetical protein